MNSVIKIDIDGDNNRFVLTGAVDSALKNRRLTLSFRRLNYQKENTKIFIPFNIKTKILTLQQLQEVLQKYEYSVDITNEVKKDVNNFYREIKTFRIFSEKARKIRNDEFEEYPELISEFDNFQKLIKKSLVRKLYPLQILSAYHMAFAQNACNFAVPGAGKTSIVYGAYTYLKSLPENDSKKVDKLLVVGPLSSFAPWENEYKECFGISPKSQRLSGDINLTREHKERHLYSGNPSEITLIFHGGVDNLRFEIIDFLKNNKTMVVVDEAHRIKNPDGVWGKSIVEIAKEARSRIILTGTPAPNGYEDLFNLYKFIYPYKYKDILKFHRGNLADMTKNCSPENSRVIEFTKNIEPYFIRIKKKDLKLPPTTEQIIEVEMDAFQREIYDFIEIKYIQSFQKNSAASVKDILNKAKLIRLRQAATNPSLLAKTLKDSLANDKVTGEIDPNSMYTENIDEYLEDSEFFSKICNYSKREVPPKFKVIKNIITDKIIKNNEKVIIWSIFILNAKELKSYLSKQKINSELLIGEVEQAKREWVIDNFNNPSNNDFQVVIANPFSVSESISLHMGCHNAIYLERDYNCANFLQSKDRIHRVGLPETQKTNYYYLLSKNSIDGVINHRLDLKVERMKKIIDSEIPLFARINDFDETDIIKALLDNYAKKS